MTAVWIVFKVVALNKNWLCLTNLSLFGSQIWTEIPHCVARPAGTEEWHSCSPVAFCLWQQSLGSSILAPARRRCFAKDCPENETRGFTTWECSTKNDGTCFLSNPVCFLFIYFIYLFVTKFNLVTKFFFSYLYRATVISVFSLLYHVDEIKMMS